MNFFRNLTIRGKIVSIVLFIIALVLAISFYSIYSLDAVNRRLSDIIDIDTQKIKLVNRIDIDLLEIHRAQKNLIMSLTKEQVDRFTSHALQYRNELHENVAKLHDLAGEKEHAWIEQLRIYYEEFLRVHNEIELLIHNDWQASGPVGEAVRSAGTEGVNSRAFELSAGSGRIAYGRVSQVLHELAEGTEASLETSRTMSRRYVHATLMAMLVLSAMGIAAGLSAGLLAARSIAANLNAVVSVTNSIAKGDLETPVDVNSRDEIGDLASSVSKMQAALVRARDEARERDWLKTGIARVNDAMRGRVNVSDLCTHALSEMATYLGAHVGALFLLDGAKSQPVLQLAGRFAYANDNGFPQKFKPGEGLVGQCALDGKQIIVRDVPEDYVKVCSGLGESCPRCITFTPLFFEDRLKGVAELGFLHTPTDLELEYLAQIMPAIGVTIETVQGREDLAEALAQAQALTEELQQQQEELQAANEELEEQTQLLEQSHKRLSDQQEELEAANQELEEKNEYLERQKRAVEQANREVERARLDLEEKAEQLAVASRYKSEFLANMSHELRTPLNSMLLLAMLLMENREGNLTDEQVRSAQIIHGSGNDLLSLINEVLDLAKIEAGRMDLHIEKVPVQDVAADLMTGFKHLTDDKGLSLDVTVEENCANELWTDRKRLDQILRNLMSNAVKFTESGGIRVRFACPEEDLVFSQGLRREDAISIAIEDAGVGIPPHKHHAVFEAFQQLEGGTSRKYGGTGLGLSISRELVHLLGGEIHLVSEEGKGSIFTVTLPLRLQRSESADPKPRQTATPQKSKSEGGLVPAQPLQAAARCILDDRTSLCADDPVILIVEDDQKFAELLRDVCHEKGFKCLHAVTGEEGLTLAGEHAPKGILLDIKLPGRDGWAVLEELKENPGTRHIPVHILSVEDTNMEAFLKGAIGFLTKPVTREELEEVFQRLEHAFSRQVKDLLVVEDDEHLRKSIVMLTAGNDVHADEVGSAREAIQAIRSKRYDCMILDLGLPDMNGLEMLKLLDADEEVSIPPVIVYTGRELTSEEEAELRGYSESIIVKGVRSEERLIDEAALFLHCMVEKMPAKKRQMITNLYDTTITFRGKQILIVDDDMRNAFALSRVLGERGVRTLKAENGAKALELLEKHPDVDLVLMDMMMPVLDGYETMRRIRVQERFRKLPIIALTAKAMKQDRERCIAAGASDYLSKPVDVSRLFSMMRVWLYR